MKEEKWEILCKDVIIVYDAKPIEIGEIVTNIKEIRNYIVVTCGKENPQEKATPQKHNIAILILNESLCTDEMYEEIANKIKEQYGENLQQLSFVEQSWKSSVILNSCANKENVL